MKEGQMRAGFTTLEIILVVALLSLIVVAIAPFFGATVTGWGLKDRQVEILQNGRVGMDEMVRLIKGAKQFTTAGTSSITFIDAGGDNVQFRLQSSVLEKKEGGDNWDALAGPVNNLTFTYYDKKGNPTFDPTKVRSVKIAMVVADSEGKVSPVTFNSQVTPRKDYLGSVYKLAINEINYNTPWTKDKDERKNEWVEIHNFGSGSLDLKDWIIEDNDDADRLAKWGEGTTIVPAGGYAVLVASGSKVFDNYPVDPSATKVRTDANKICEGLDDDSGTIMLKDPDGTIIVDSVTYDDGWGGDGDGNTIERKNAQASSSDPNNWEASSVVETYTPGSANTASLYFWPFPL